MCFQSLQSAMTTLTVGITHLGKGETFIRKEIKLFRKFKYKQERFEGFFPLDAFPTLIYNNKSCLENSHFYSGPLHP